MKRNSIEGHYDNPLRWGDSEDDSWWGPFTYSRAKHQPIAVILTSWGDGQDDERPCNLRISAGRLGTLIIRLPNGLLGPNITKVYPADWTLDSEVVKRLGRDYYNVVDARSYGFTMSNSGTVGDSIFLSVHYGHNGGSTMDSSIEQRWSCFLPWTQWRHVRHSYYGLEGNWLYDEPQGPWQKLGDDWRARRDQHDAQVSVIPTMMFDFLDFDGEPLKATTMIEEREWHHGEDWFRWLSWFSRPKIARSLHIEFSGETGRRKGSWKGGTIGHSIEMQHDELHYGAFVRYCEKHDMKFVGFGETVKA